MNHTKYAVLLLACVFLTKLAWGAGQEDVSKPEGLISQSNGLGDIWTEGTPPTSVRAELQLLGAKGTLVQGDYDFEWISPSQWKEVIRAGNYVRVRVGDSKGYWQKSSLNHQPNTSLYAVIEADGSLSNITLLQQATPSLEAATLEAVRHWRYKPATCGQMPVRLETRIIMEFRIPDSPTYGLSAVR